MAGDWSDEQNDAIVADYFAMLGDDIAGRPYSKAEHNRLLQAVIDRPRSSIEYKHQNISAVLKGLGEDWIPGYKPAFNFQASLVDAVVRWLQRHPDWLAPTARMAMGPSPSVLREEAMLWIGPPPTHSNAPLQNSAQVFEKGSGEKHRLFRGVLSALRRLEGEAALEVETVVKLDQVAPFPHADGAKQPNVCLRQLLSDSGQSQVPTLRPHMEAKAMTAVLPAASKTQ